MAGSRLIIVSNRLPITTKIDGGSIAFAPASGGLGLRNVLVSCRIDNSSLLLKSEMSGRAKIYCGRRRILDLKSEIKDLKLQI